MEQSQMRPRKHNPMAAAIRKAMANSKVKMRPMPKPKEPKHSCPSSAEEYYYPPTIYLSDKDFPGIKDWQFGQTVHLVITAEVGSISMRDEGKGAKRYNTDLKNTSIGDLMSGTGHDKGHKKGGGMMG